MFWNLSRWGVGQAERSQRRWLLLVGLFVVALVGLAQGQAQAEWSAGANGTIPPGGTIPPPTVDLVKGQVRVIHLAPFAATPSETAVDLCTAGSTPVTGFTDLVYLEQSGYQLLDPGVYDWQVGAPGCSVILLDVPPFTLNRGAVLTLYLVGDRANQPLATLLSVEQPGFANIRFFPVIANRS